MRMHIHLKRMNQSLALSWLPRADGDFLTGPPQELVLEGSVADIPFVTGVGWVTYPTHVDPS